MKEPYLTELPGFIDLDYMKGIADNMLTDEWKSLSDVEALARYTDVKVVDVEADDYLKGIRDKYPKLKNHIKLMKCSKGSWPIHIDAHRSSAISIPVTNCDNTKTTKFFTGGEIAEKIYDQFGDKKGIWQSNEWLTYVENAELACEHATVMPTLINTKVPHQIVNSTDSIRVIFSWAYEAPYAEAVADLT